MFHKTCEGISTVKFYKWKDIFIFLEISRTEILERKIYNKSYKKLNILKLFHAVFVRNFG